MLRAGRSNYVGAKLQVFGGCMLLLQLSSSAIRPKVMRLSLARIFL